MNEYRVEPRTIAEQRTAVAQATLDVGEIPSWLGRTYAQVVRVLEEQGIRPTGSPFGRYHRLADGSFTVEAGFPVSGTIRRDGAVHASSLPGGAVAATLHVGPYEEMAPAYEALQSWVRDHGGAPRGDAWERYFTDPEAEPDPATWRTEVVQPYDPS